MSRDKAPVTPAVRFLRAHGVAFTDHLYDYEERGGTVVSARELGVPEHQVIKTLVMENERREPLLVLMHGDMEVSTGQLARALGVKAVTPCSADTAHRHTGYLVGGTSPFGTRKPLPVCLERGVLDLATIYINGGKRGYLVAMAPAELQRLLRPTLVAVGIPKP